MVSMMTGKKVLIVIPAYNEEPSLGKVIEEVTFYVPQADVLVVNDGSTDATARIAREERVLILDHPYNMGIGATMQTGFVYALRNDYDIAVQIDADGQHDPAFLPSLIEPILKGQSNLVIGSRYLSEEGFKSTFLRKLGIAFFACLIRILTRIRVTDPTSGFRAVDRKGIGIFSEEYPSDYPEVEAVISAYKQGLTFREVSVRMRRRQGGTSSIGVLSALYYMVKVTLSVSVGFFRSNRA